MNDFWCIRCGKYVDWVDEDKYCEECARYARNIVVSDIILKTTVQKQRGRIPPSKMEVEMQDNVKRYGTDQDKDLTVSREVNSAGQQIFIIKSKGGTMYLSLRSAIDLMNKLGKNITDALTEAMLLFIKDKL